MEHYNWGLPIALDLFAAGMGAAAFMVAVVADLKSNKQYDSIRFTGAIIAPWPVILGVLLLVVDLGKPLRFWEMMLRRGEGLSLEAPYLMLNSGSTMSWGTWLLSIFVCIALLYLVASILLIPVEWGRKVTRVIGVIGLPFALAVVTYTGVLISACNNALWRTPMLPLVFVASAMATGIAAIVCVLAVLKAIKIIGTEDKNIPLLERLNSWLLLTQLALLLIFVVAGIGAAEMRAMIGLKFGLIFWIGVIGLGTAVPLMIMRKKEVRTPLISLGLAALVLLGGIFLRYAILMSGQIT